MTVASPDLIWDRDPVRVRPEYLIAGCAAAAGLLHGWAFPSHAAEWWGYGAAFALLALGQAALAFSVLRWGLKPAIALSGGALMVASIGLWAVSRTSGIPVFGPHAGLVEPIGPVDVTAKALEAMALLALARAGRTDPSPSTLFSRRRPASVAGALSLCLLLASAAVGTGSVKAHTHEQSVGGTELLAQHPADEEAHEPMPDETTVHEEDDHDEVPEPEEERCEVADGPAVGRAGEGAVVTAHRGVLRFADSIDADATALAGSHGGPCWIASPTFLTEQTVGFVGGGGLHTYDLGSGGVDRLTPDGVTVWTYGADAAGSRILALTSDPDQGDIAVVELSDGSEQRTLMDLQVEFFGACGGETWESSITFSPSERSAMLVEPSFARDQIMVFRLDGTVVEVLDGTDAVWLDDDSIAYRVGGEEPRWYRHSLATGARDRLDMDPQGYRPRVSPDRTRIAYATLDPIAVHVYDLRTDESRIVAEDHADPQWVDARHVVAAGYRPCEDCHEPVGESGSADLIEVTERSSRAVRLESTKALDIVTAEPTDPEPIPDPEPSASPEPSPSTDPEPSPSSEPSPSADPTALPTSTPLPDASPSPSPGGSG